jgi:hypothetical protein
MPGIVYVFAFVIALGTIGCGSDIPQRAKAADHRANEKPPLVEEPRPNQVSLVVPPLAQPAAAPISAIPAMGKPDRPSLYKVRHVMAAPAAQAGIEESPASKLAAEILQFPLAERLEWTKKEFAKRGITDVHDDQ